MGQFTKMLKHLFNFIFSSSVQSHCPCVCAFIVHMRPSAPSEPCRTFPLLFTWQQLGYQLYSQQRRKPDFFCSVSFCLLLSLHRTGHHRIALTVFTDCNDTVIGRAQELQTPSGTRCELSRDDSVSETRV